MLIPWHDEWSTKHRVAIAKMDISNLSLVVLALIHACVNEIHVVELKYGLKSDIITRPLYIMMNRQHFYEQSRWERCTKPVCGDLEHVMQIRFDPTGNRGEGVMMRSLHRWGRRSMVLK